MCRTGLVSKEYGGQRPGVEELGGYLGAGWGLGPRWHHGAAGGVANDIQKVASGFLIEHPARCPRWEAH